MAEPPFKGLTLGDTGPARAVSFTKDKLDQLGNDFGGRAGDVGALAERTGAIGIDPPAFGVLGIGLNSAHDQARNNAVEALRAGKAVIESWNKALKDANTNYKNADDSSGAKDGDGGGRFGGGDLGGLGGGLGGGGLPGGGLGMPGAGGAVPDPKLPDPGALDPSGTGPKLPDPGALDPSGTGPKLPDPGALDPAGADPKLPDPRTLDPAATGLDPNGPANNLARQGLGLDDPTRTALSAYNPGDGTGNGTVAQPRLPGTTWAEDSQGPGSPVRGGFSAGTGGGGAVPLGGVRGSGAGGAGGVPMMPLMPPGGGPGGEQGKEREKSTWMSEDEGVWGGDEDIAPPVIGQDP